VLDASASCAPIPRAAVDIWQCDALGIYSGYEGAAIAPRHVEPVDDKTFLRGTQLADRAGGVRFERSIRAGTWPHPARPPEGSLGAKAATTQLYFPDEVTNAVYARAPYNGHPNRDTTNARTASWGRSPTVPGDVDDGARRGRLCRRRHHRAPDLLALVYFHASWIEVEFRLMVVRLKRRVAMFTLVLLAFAQASVMLSAARWIAAR